MRAACLAAAALACGANAAAQCPTQQELDALRVTAVSAFHPRQPNRPLPEVALRDGITVTVDGLPALLRQAACTAQRQKVVLFLDGRPLPDLQPYPPSNAARQTLNFVLNRTETSRDVWTHLLGRPTFAPRDVAVSVGLQDGAAIASDVTLRLRVIPMGWFALWSSLLAILAVSFIVLARRSDVLRDPGPAPAPGVRKPYSLARTQAATWFFLILASYVFIGMVTGDYATTITNTVLGLMGISAGTVVGSSLIDQSPAGAATIPQPSRGWLPDILSDSYGVSFHRFQMATWTLVLAIVFIQQVYGNLAMPDFDITLLGLMGISAGTYLGLKTTAERK